MQRDRTEEVAADVRLEGLMQLQHILIGSIGLIDIAVSLDGHQERGEKRRLTNSELRLVILYLLIVF
jgi:hypothetical protein